MHELRERVQGLAGSSSLVLVRGPTGSGKDLVARALHEAGPRRGRPFVALNVTAFPETLFESQLFGHLAGAFSGAVQARQGQLERASSGTIFFDEIGDLPPALQVKLLRVLEERTFLPVGGLEERRLEARIVAATHVDLERRVEQGRFREDLYFRLSLVELHVPALKERREDIPLLAHAFARAAERPALISAEALDLLKAADWNGNVRQLRGLIEKLALFCDGAISAKDVLRERSFQGTRVAPPPTPAPDDLVERVLAIPGRTLREKLDELEAAVMRATVARSGSISEAAYRLGTTRRTLRTRLSAAPSHARNRH